MQSTVSSERVNEIQVIKFVLTSASFVELETVSDVAYVLATVKSARTTVAYGFVIVDGVVKFTTSFVVVA